MQHTHDHTVDVDLDGVVYPPFSYIMSNYLSKFGFDLPEEVEDWDFLPRWGLDERDFEAYVREGIIEGYVFGEGVPVRGAVEGLARLDSAGFRIRLVTSRLAWPGLHGMIQQNTAEWLDTEGIPYHSIWYQGKGDTKNTDGIILFDDRPENVTAHNNGILFPYLNNLKFREENPNVRYTNSWHEFTELAIQASEAHLHGN